MKKFHWGHGILLFFIFYVGILLTAVFQSTRIDHSLVVDEYYKQDLAYQIHYDKSVNAVKHQKDFAIVALEGGSLAISFNDNESKTGFITFYNPSDKSKDFQLPINMVKGQDQIPLIEVPVSGRWKVKADWESQGTSYFIEKELYIPLL